MWRTINLSVDGKNLTSINFANISHQVKFIDTYKYFQQSLSVLAHTMSNEIKKGSVLEIVVRNFLAVTQN